MSPDQNFIAPILRNPGITKIACVYDFIPFDDQKTYLAHSISRLEYFAAMALLRRCPAFPHNLGGYGYPPARPLWRRSVSRYRRGTPGPQSET